MASKRSRLLMNLALQKGDNVEREEALSESGASTSVPPTLASSAAAMYNSRMSLFEDLHPPPSPTIGVLEKCNQWMGACSVSVPGNNLARVRLVEYSPSSATSGQSRLCDNLVTTKENKDVPLKRRKESVGSCCSSTKILGSGTGSPRQCLGARQVFKSIQNNCEPFLFTASLSESDVLSTPSPRKRATLQISDKKDNEALPESCLKQDNEALPESCLKQSFISRKLCFESVELAKEKSTTYIALLTSCDVSRETKPPSSDLLMMPDDDPDSDELHLLHLDAGSAPVAMSSCSIPLDDEAKPKYVLRKRAAVLPQKTTDTSSDTENLHLGAEKWLGQDSSDESWDNGLNESISSGSDDDALKTNTRSRNQKTLEESLDVERIFRTEHTGEGSEALQEENLGGGSNSRTREDSTEERFEASDTMKSQAGSQCRKQREERRRLCNAGEAYTTSTGKVVPQKIPIPLTPCRRKCKDRICEEDREAVNKEYWGLECHDKRVQYIATHVFSGPKKYHRVRDEDLEKPLKNRTCTNAYYFDVRQERIAVCKKCFFMTLRENDRFVRTVLDNKKESTSGVTKPDRRGRHTPANKTPDHVLTAVQAHIQSFPAYESYHSRRHTAKKYLASELTITKMHKLYLQTTRPQVSYNTYHREFQKSGLKFKPPKIDTCAKCDQFKAKLMVLQGEEKTQCEKEKKEHQDKAEKAYTEKRKDKISCVNDESKMAFALDLQQCLPCPLLKTSSVYYLRQLYVFNLTIHNLVPGLPINCMWDETEGGRGGNQVASCIHTFLKEYVPPTVKHITFYSDTCTGQNKNSHMCAMFQVAVKEHPSLELIDHKYLVSGHTHLECDWDHSIIEKKKKKYLGPIHHPKDWYSVVRSCGKTNSFIVKEMRQDFFNYAALLKDSLVLRKVNTDGDSFTFAPVQWFRYCKQNFGIVKYKHSLDEEQGFFELSFRRRGPPVSRILLTRCYDGPVPISKEKKADLLKMLDLIDPLYHPFYQSILVSGEVRNIDPDLPADGVEIEVEEP